MVAVLGAILVLSVIAYLIYFEISFPANDTQITIEPHRVERTADGFRVAFRVHNGGASSVATLRIRGELRKSDALSAVSEAVFDYLPGFSSRWGALYFHKNPGEGELKFFAVSFVQP
jgi:uncharacterized protein (TIGR02588 family)